MESHQHQKFDPLPALAELDLSRAITFATKRARTGAALKARREALSLIGSESLATAKCSFRNIPLAELETSSGSLLREGVPQSTGLTALAAMACTLGPALEERVSALCAERRISLALALDEAGNELLFHAVRLAARKVRGEGRRLGYSTGETLAPGGRGLTLDHQGEVVGLAGGERIGITVTGQGMLLPVKSRSILVSVGEGLRAKPLRRRCDICSSRERCRHRMR